MSEETTATLSAAMAKAFASIDGAVKDSQNPHFKNRYADLSAVIDAIKPALVANDLWMRQVTHESDRGVTVETIVHHAGGDSLSFGKLFVPASKMDAQGFGSSLTYAKRYSLTTAFCLRVFDDDAELARVSHDRDAKKQTNDALLETLRNAALDGPEILQKAFALNKAAPGFAATWQQHGEALKAAAAQAQPA